jgi:hypothetical protein
MQVFNARYEFVCKEQEAALLNGVTLSELQQFYATHLAPTSTQRRKLTIQVAPSRTAKGKAGVKGAEQQQPDAAAAAAPHVQHEHGMMHQNSPGRASRHVFGATVVHAGNSSTAMQQNGTADADAAAAAGSPTARQLSAKRQRRQQEQRSESEAAPVGGVVRPPGVQLQLVTDPLQFKQGRERYPVYCTVTPQLARKQ